MKNFKICISIIIYLLLYKINYSQTTLYNQTFGSFPTGWTVSPTNGWYIDNTQPSNCPGSSSGSNIRTSTAFPITYTLTYNNNLSTVGYSNITVLWAGVRYPGVSSIIFQWSTDGIIWNTPSFTDVSPNTNWYWVNGGTRISLGIGATGATNLQFKWIVTIPLSGKLYRLDDFTVKGTACTLSLPATSVTGVPSICQGASITLGITGGNLGTSANWNWYSGSCGGTYITSGTSPTVTPNTTTTYWVRAEGVCNTTTCVSTTTFVTYNTWVGVNNNWSSVANWTCSVPTSTTNILIPSTPTGGNFPVITGSEQCLDITIQTGATVNISSGSSLTISGNLLNNGNILGTGDIIFNNGTQNITGTTSILGNLYITAGNTLNTNNNLIIESGASLMSGVGTPGAGGLINGNVTIKKTGSAGTFTIYVNNFWSSPITTGNTSIFGWYNPNIYWFNPDIATSALQMSDGWVACPNTNMLIGRGYSVGTTNTVTTINASFTGQPNDGTISYLAKNNGAAANDGWNLVGNPYPSSISVADFLSNATNSTTLDAGYNAVYLWTDDNSGGTGYTNGTADFTIINTIGITSPTGGGATLLNPNKIISSCQGFEIKAASTSNIEFTNSMRSTTNNVFYKSTGFPLLKLGITNPTNYYNEIIVAFKSDATDLLDNMYDARKLKGNADLSLYTFINSDEYAIQTLASLNGAKTVPVGIYAGKTGSYTFNASFDDFIPGTTIGLEDVVTGLYTDLILNPNYSFTVTNTGSINNRFILHFNYNPTEINNSQDNYIDIYSYDNNVYIDNQYKNEGNIYVYDLLGQIVQTNKLNPSLNKMNILSKGCYIIKVITNDKGVFSKKVFIN